MRTPAFRPPAPVPLAPYPSPEQRDAELTAAAARAQGELTTWGHSAEGRPLLAARLPQLGAGGNSKSTARVMITGNIHGIEYVAAQVALGVLHLSDTLPTLRRLRARAEVWVLPCLNPDGYAATWEADGRGPVARLRTNAHGVDLNRNFPLPPGQSRARRPGAGSRRPGAATFVGSHPLSEPESAALAALLSEHRFSAAMNVHSYLGAVIPPRVLTRNERSVYRSLCRAYRAAQPGHRSPRLASRWFDTFTGELEDFQHHVHGLWAACAETFSIAGSLKQRVFRRGPFWAYNPRQPERWVANDVPGIAAFLHAALDRPPPHVGALAT